MNGILAWGKRGLSPNFSYVERAGNGHAGNLSAQQR